MATSADELSDAYPGLSSEVADLVSLGMGGSRFDFFYSQLAGGSYTNADARVAAVQGAGRDVLGILNANGTVAGLSDSTKRATYAAYCGTIAARYPSIRLWEICNEPNLAGGTAVLIADYVQALPLAYAAIKAANPNALVGAGGLASIQTTTGGFQSAAAFVQALYDNCPQAFDFLCYHSYADSGNIDYTGHEGDGWHTRTILRVNTSSGIYGILAAQGDARRQVYITETGKPTNAPVDPPNEAKQCQWLLDVNADLANERNIGPMFWYSHYDRQDQNAATSDQGFFGARKPTGVGKRVLPELKSLATLYSSATPAFETSKAASGTVTFPLWRWFPSPTDPRCNDVTLSIVEAMPTGFSLSAGGLTIDRAAAAAQLSTPLTVRGVHANGAVAYLPITVTVQNANLHAIDEFRLAGAITGWTATNANATVSYDALDGALVCTISGSGGGWRSPQVTGLSPGTVYERGTLLIKDDYNGTQLNDFMDNAATSPSIMTVPTAEPAWVFRTYTQGSGDSSADVSSTRVGSSTGKVRVYREILRVKL